MSVLKWLLTNYRYVAFLLLCAILGAFWGWHDLTVGKLEKRASEWQRAAEDARARLTVMEQEKAAMLQAMEQQQAELARAERSRRAATAKLKEAVNNDEPARNWHGAPVPDAIIGVLQDTEAGGGHD